ncbi:MAG: hypothetical protein ACRYF2_14695, partial [Janthinobacterium lividum]
MDIGYTLAPPHLAFAGAPADGSHRRPAVILCLAVAAITVALLPFAAASGPVLPGFILINQTALVVAYGLSAWVLFAQFRRSRSVALLLIAGGTLYTAAIVAGSYWVPGWWGRDRGAGLRMAGAKTGSEVADRL